MTHIALIGCGRWGQNILRDLKLLNCYVSVVCTDAISMTRARQFNADKIYNSHQEIVGGLDGIIIATPTLKHYQNLLAYKSYNKPIFIEKPMVLHLHEAQHIASIMAEQVFVMHKWRYHPAILCLKQLWEKKLYGELREITTVRHGAMVEYDIPIYRILMPHDLSMILEITGDIPEPTVIKKYMVNNQCVGFQADLNANPKINISINGSKPEFLREIVLHFESASANFSDKNHHVIYIKNSAGKLIEAIKLNDALPLMSELNAFLNYLNGGCKPKSCMLDEIKIATCTERIENLLVENDLLQEV